jgi:hypothetical protein
MFLEIAAWQKYDLGVDTATVTPGNLQDLLATEGFAASFTDLRGLVALWAFSCTSSSTTGVSVVICITIFSLYPSGLFWDHSCTKHDSQALPAFVRLQQV